MSAASPYIPAVHQRAPPQCYRHGASILVNSDRGRSALNRRLRASSSMSQHASRLPMFSQGDTGGNSGKHLVSMPTLGAGPVIAGTDISGQWDLRPEKSIHQRREHQLVRRIEHWPLVTVAAHSVVSTSSPASGRSGGDMRIVPYFYQLFPQNRHQVNDLASGSQTIS